MQVSVADVVQKLQRVPDKYRLFSERQGSLLQRYGLPDDVLTELLDSGMPHCRIAGDYLFDATDLNNVGIDMQLPSPRWTALCGWSRSILRVGANGLYKEIGVYAECARSHPLTDCRFKLNEVFYDHPSVTEVFEENDEFFLCLETPSVHRELVDLLRPLTVRAEELRFHLLCAELAEDAGFVADTGLADCRLASLDLARIGKECGLQVRRMTGLFVAAPFPAAHAWVQIKAGQDWLSVDPFLLSTMARWGIVDAEMVPPYSSAASFVLDLHESFEPLVYDCGMPAAEHFRTVRSYL